MKKASQLLEIVFSKTSEKQIKELHASDLKKIAAKLTKLRQNPFPADASKISGSEDLYRVRVGNWRIAYQVVDKKLLRIVAIGPRNDDYIYRLLKRLGHFMV